MAHRLVTERLVLRRWNTDDAGAALGAYGDAQVARLMAPAGRWAIEHRQDRRVIGGATRLPLPPDEEFEMGWQLHPQEWGHGYATETGLALARWAFEQGIEQVIAVVRP